jgi:hypothetical protein
MTQLFLFIPFLTTAWCVLQTNIAPDKATVPDQPLFSDDVREQLESRLMDVCGSECLDFFHQVFPLVSNVSVNDPTSMKDQFTKFNEFFNSFVADGEKLNLKLRDEIENLNKTVVSFAAKDTSSQKTIPPQPGLPCRTQAECKALDFSINRCSHIRSSAMDAYTKANTAVAVMAQMISAMCGCVFTGPVRLCILAPIPYVCGFPFEAYRGLFGLSMALWSAVVITSNTCSTVGVDITSLVPKIS